MDQRLLAIPTYTLHAVTITLHRNVDAFSRSVQAAIAAAASVEPGHFSVREQIIELLLDKKRLFAVAALDEVRSLDEASLSHIRNEVPVAMVPVYDGHDLSQPAWNAHSQASPKIEHPHDPDKSQTFAEPITMAWAATQVAAGVLAWIGSKAMDSIFAGSGNKPVTLSEESIQRLATIFAQTVAAAQLQEAKDKLRSLQLNVNEYNNAPATSLDRLHRATVDSLDLLATLARFRWSGLQAYLLAGTLRCAILQERLTVLGTPGELLNLHAHIQQCFVDYTLAWNEEQEMFNALSGPVICVPSAITHAGPLYYAIFNNKYLGYVSSEAEAYASLAKAQQDFFAKEISPLYEESKTIASAWQALRTEVRNRIQAAGLPMPDIDVHV